jgi:hypothetical protein
MVVFQLPPDVGASNRSAEPEQLTIRAAGSNSSPAGRERRVCSATAGTKRRDLRGRESMFLIARAVQEGLNLGGRCYTAVSILKCVVQQELFSSPAVHNAIDVLDRSLFWAQYL